MEYKDLMGNTYKPTGEVRPPKAGEYYLSESYGVLKANMGFNSR